MYFGALVILEKLIGKAQWYQKTPAPCKWLGTLFLVMMGWVLFRSSSVSEALAYFKLLATGSESVVYSFRYFFDSSVYIAAAAGILLTLPRPARLLRRAAEQPAALILYDVWMLCVLMISIFFMLNSTYQSFIYFQF